MHDVRYFCVIDPLGEKEIYFAARDGQDVLDFYRRTNPLLRISKLPKIKEISEEEAQKALHFEDFAGDYSLCADGTFMLGPPSKKI